MICRNCGTENEQGTRYCTACGAMFEEAPVQANTVYNNEEYYNPQEGAYGYADNGNNGYYNNAGNGGYYQNPAQPYYGMGYMPPANDKIPEITDYLKWMLLYPLLNFIPAVGFIVYLAFCIKNAFDNSFKARANFFKAMLIVQGISVALVLVLAAIFGVVIAVFAEAYPEFDLAYYM